jgi:hypothetical protein
MLTLTQAVNLAGERYHKRPARDTLKTAVKEGRLPARKAKVTSGQTAWVVDESDLAAYLENWTPGQAAPPGNKRRVGKQHSEETKAQIAASERATKAKLKSKLE